MADSELVPPPPWIADNLGFLLARAGKRSSELFREGLAPLGIRPKHYSVLSVLLHDGAQTTQQGVAGCLEIEPSSVVSVVDELELLGLLQRRKDPLDRRRNRLALTDGGRAVLLRAQEVAADVERRLFGSLTAEQRTAVEGILVSATQAHPAVGQPG